MLSFLKFTCSLWPRRLLLPVLLLPVACGGSGSNDDSGSNLDTGPESLNPPGFVEGEPDSQGFVTITWLDSSEGEEGFVVERRLPDSDDWAPIEFLPPDTESAIDRNTTENQTFFYRVVAFADGRAEASPEVRITVPDLAPPDTELIFHPPQRTRRGNAEFAFRSNESDVIFRCSLDGVPRPCSTNLTCFDSDQACTGRINVTVDEGEHSFTVAAEDAGGNIDPQPATFQWSVDQTPPQIEILSAPQDPTSDTGATIIVTSNDPDALLFCQFSNQGSRQPCEPNTPFTTDFGQGAPINPWARVWDQDSVGNERSREINWTIDRIPPQVLFTGGPGPLIQAQNELDFQVRIVEEPTGGTPAGLRETDPIECIFPGETAWEPCIGSQTGEIDFTVQNVPTSDGTFDLQVRATDRFGFSREAVTAWTVDSTAPEPYFTNRPFDDASMLQWGFAATENNPFPVRFFCSFQGATATECATPLRFDNRLPDSYTLEVTAMDLAGNVDAALTATDTVVTDFPGFTTDICLAGGGVFTIRSGLGEGWLIENGNAVQTSDIQPFNQVHTGRFDPEQDPLHVTFSYRMPTTDAMDLTLYKTTPIDPDAKTEYNTASPPRCASDVRINGNNAGQRINTASGSISTNKILDERWDYELSLRRTVQTNQIPPEIISDEISFSPPDVDHVILRPVHPNHRWIIDPVEPWRFVADVTARTGVEAPQPTTLEIWTETPAGDRLAEQVLDWSALNLSGLDTTLVDLPSDAPHCNGWVGVHARAWAVSDTVPAYHDVIRLPVSAATADRFEPNNTSTDATNLPTLSAPDMHVRPNQMLDPDPAADWYMFDTDAAGVVSVTIATPDLAAGDAETLTATLYQGSTANSIDNQQATATELTLSSGNSVGPDDFWLEVQRNDAEPACVRYRMEISVAP